MVGKATVENGALLSADNHNWFHQQSKSEQERMNRAFQEYKSQVDSGITLNVADITLEGIKDYHQITFDELGIEYETISLEDNTEEDKEFLDVTEGMSEEEIREYEKHKVERVKRMKEKLGSIRKEEVKRPHAHIDEDWQKEIIEDVLNELRY